MANSMVSNIDKVVRRARERYSDLMQSSYVGKNMRIDGVGTKGQVQDNKRSVTIKEAQTKICTCMLDVKVHRGSLVEIQPDEDIEGYSLKGVCNSIPNKTPVDFYFSVLLFNTTVIRRRYKPTYSPDGDVIEDATVIEDEIPCFVQRVGIRERQVDMGIDRDSVNEIITTIDWDIQKDDILYVGTDKYRITDIEELDKDIFSAYMTYYRE